MRKLIAVTYDTEFKAEEVRLQFLKMQKSYLVTDKVLDALRGTGGTVLQSSLSHEDEAKLQAALNSARAAQKDAE